MKSMLTLDNPLLFAVVALTFGLGWPVMAKVVAMIMRAAWI